MSEVTYYSIPTTLGLSKLAQLQTIQLIELAVGDGSGSVPDPASNPIIVNEVWRGDINAIDPHKTNSNWLVIQCIIPASVGGWSIREFGIFDSDGDLLFVGNHPETYKPILSEGAGGNIRIDVIIQLATAEMDKIELLIDPSVVLATRDYVDNTKSELVQKINLKANILDVYTRDEINIELTAIGGGVPVGAIISFSGTYSMIPENWKICNGQTVSDERSPMNNYETPDLSNKFIMGAPQESEQKETGGNFTTAVSAVALPAHSHTIAHSHTASHNHSASASSTGNHTHGVRSFGSSGGDHSRVSTAGSATEYGTMQTNYSGAHSTSIAVNTIYFSTGGSSAGSSGNAGSGSGNHSHSFLPPYYKFAQIIRIF